MNRHGFLRWGQRASLKDHSKAGDCSWLGGQFVLELEIQKKFDLLPGGVIWFLITSLALKCELMCCHPKSTKSSDINRIVEKEGERITYGERWKSCGKEPDQSFPFPKQCWGLSVGELRQYERCWYPDSIDLWLHPMPLPVSICFMLQFEKVSVNGVVYSSSYSLPGQKQYRANNNLMEDVWVRVSLHRRQFDHPLACPSFFSWNSRTQCFPPSPSDSLRVVTVSYLGRCF